MPYKRRTAAAWATHPGEILKKDFLKPMGISGYALAKAIGVNPQRVSDITLSKSGVSADMAIRLEKFFGVSAEFWMNLQAGYELATAKKQLKSTISRIKPHISAA